jgi:hypothetical protein
MAVDNLIVQRVLNGAGIWLGFQNGSPRFSKPSKCSQTAKSASANSAFLLAYSHRKAMSRWKTWTVSNWPRRSVGLTGIPAGSALLST